MLIKAVSADETSMVLNFNVDTNGMDFGNTQFSLLAVELHLYLYRVLIASLTFGSLSSSMDGV